MSIQYISTRGQGEPVSFEDAVLTGLAPDGGLYVPERLPQFSAADIAGFAGLDYVSLAQRILAPFTEGALAPKELRALLEQSYAAFPPDVAPLTQLSPDQYVLELFHGPTLAFKDFALQFLGNLLEHLLRQRGQKATVLGATSGDTGSAAIAGLSGRGHINIFILHPHGRVSDVQRRQMTTVLDANVHNLAVRGTFDDCQDMVKALFSDASFRSRNNLVAVNSINWARILAQVVYYFYVGAALGRPVRFVVPTGNFGDIYAGYVAKNMGLPVEKLVIATNTNDILARCLHSGEYAARGVVHSLSPSMDIQVSSNFERLLFDLYDRDGARINTLMQEFRNTRCITLGAPQLNRLRNDFFAHSADDAATRSTIAGVYSKTGFLADPHTAVGLAAAAALPAPAGVPVVTLATAHAAKFPEAVQAATGVHPALPQHLKDLLTRRERFEVMANDISQVQRYITEHA